MSRLDSTHGTFSRQKGYYLEVLSTKWISSQYNNNQAALGPSELVVALDHNLGLILYRIVYKYR